MKRKASTHTIRHWSRRLTNGEDGSAMVEFAIMLPVLLILFAGAAELGRLFYTYTTLAKATEVGARYLSTSFQATSPVAADATAAQNIAKSLAVCGHTTCTNQTPIVPGLTTSNITVTFPIRNNIRYAKVQITGYTYGPGVFHLAHFTGKANTVFYFGLTPATEMRYMETQ
jgi:Flp pilus assembly protein TadG